MMRILIGIPVVWYTEAVKKICLSKTDLNSVCKKTHDVIWKQQVIKVNQ